MTVGDLCTRMVVTADPEESIFDAATRMRDLHVGDLVVVDEDQRPIGILTDRDIVVGALADGIDPLDVPRVGEVMTRDLVTAMPDESLSDVLGRMRVHGIRRLPVVSASGRLEGLIALDDILEQMSADLRELAGLVAREQKRERAVRA
ncbi:MAG: CBS domain-containing protein [Vicinamibacterales bacterium]